MKEATQGGLGGVCFKPPKPECAPCLEAFKMIKVIGKGSFGEFKHISVLFRTTMKCYCYMRLHFPRST